MPFWDVIEPHLWSLPAWCRLFQHAGASSEVHIYDSVSTHTDEQL